MRPLGRVSVRGATKVAGLVVVALLATAGCAATGNETNDPLQPPPGTVRLYGVDGNMLNSVGALVKDFPDGLDGMKGTAPFTRLPRVFQERLRGVDPGLNDDLYAAETYDAVIISGLAAQIARSNRPKDIAAQINGVTTGGTTCESAAQCLDLIADGKDIAYRGISLRLGGFTDVGEPSASTYGIFRFTKKNTLASNLTEFVPAGDPAAESQKRPPAAGQPHQGALKIGALLPKSGQLAGAGPPMFAGAKLAVQELNAAGGVLGHNIEYTEADDGTHPDVAKTNAKKLINEGVHVIIGASGSGISAAILPTVVDAGVILFSPCNTAAALTDVDDKGLYFRTAPPDGLQARALTDIVMRDGVRRVYVIARNDAYGKPFLEAVRDNLIEAGISADNIKTVLYDAEEPNFADPDKPNFIDVGADVKDYAPDGVVVIGYEESADALKSIMLAGLKSRVI